MMRNAHVVFAQIALVISAIGCNGATSPRAHVSVLANATPTVARLSQPISITITVTNDSNSPADVDVSECPLPFVVADANGNIVGPSTLGTCSAVRVTKTLAPGEHYVMRQTWSGSTNAGASQAVVAPGTYSIRSRIVGDAVTNTSATIQIVP